MENEKDITIYFIIFIDIFGIGMAARTLYNVIYTIEGSINYKDSFSSILQNRDVGRSENLESFNVEHKVWGGGE